jgi:hypothetical protein
VTAALLRYLAADFLRSQRWVAPVLAFLGGVALFNVAGGPLLTTYADTSTVLLPVSIWLAVTVANSEDPMQAAVTAVTIGGDLRLRLGKLLTAWVAGAACTVVAVLWPLLTRGYTGRAGVGEVAAGAGAHLLVAGFGVAVGSFGMWAVLPRVGWTVLFATAACLADLLVPHAPPTRRILELFDGGAVGALLPVALETALIAGVLVAVSTTVALRRS